MDYSEQIAQLRKKERLVFSLISGYNYYSIPTQTKNGDVISEALHRDTDILYVMYPGEILDPQWQTKQIDRHREFVLKPVYSRQIEWPIDLVKICFDSKKGAVERLYYVFLKKPILNVQPLKKLLYVDRDNDVLDWNNTQIQQVAVSFLEAMKALHKAGYAYNSFDVRRMQYDVDNGQVYLHYTGAIRKFTSNPEKDRFMPHEVAVEFAPPCEGIHRDRYAIAAILFRLMIGRLPYQGCYMENNTHVFDMNYYDLDQDECYQEYFEAYRQRRCFVFDPDDHTNPLSPGSEDDLPRARWKALPQRIKTMFIHSLAYTDEAKRSKMLLFTPGQWQEALTQECWHRDKGGVTNG